MTQQEYKHKKRECWKNFKFARRPLNTDNKIFDFIFDRAYALGKQKETITQEDVNKAAREAVRKEYLCESCPWKNDCDLCGGENTAFDCCECPADSYEDGFKAGANFALGKKVKDADTVIQGWVCRDKEWDKTLFASDLYLSAEKPKRDKHCGAWTNMGAYIPLNTDLFHDLTWESDPQEVEITIKRKKNR